MPDRRFCFVLGAGASKPSGIPTAGELGVDWLRKLHTEGGGVAADFAQWLNEGAHGIKELPSKTNITDIAAIAAAYPAIYHAKWGHDRAQGHAEIERHIEAAKPSYGYYALAEILASDDLASPSRHNVVITPNFDNLPAETLGALGKKIPIVIGHSAITEFARPTLKRPLIIKFHHDFLLSPKSDPKDVGNMADGYSKALAEIFRLYTPIVVGYGGNDGSLMGLLENLPEKSIPGGILWCWRKGDPPGSRIESVVSKQAGTLIEISGFDELMTLLEAPFGHVFNPGKLSERATDRAKELTTAKELLTKKTESGLSSAATSGGSGERGHSPTTTATASAESSALLDALTAAVGSSGSIKPKKKASLPWWHWQNRINATQDLDEKERLFEEGLRVTQNAPQLLGNYANFLKNQRKDDARAEEYYLRAIAADPNHANTLGNYALFLQIQRKDDARAEEYYLKAIAADPNHANTFGNYAVFLKNQRKDDARAEEYYLKAIAADPNHANNLGNYAVFLKNQRKDDARAEEYYLKAIAADPNHAHNLGNYALFLQNQRKDDARAEEYYLKAIAADPNHAHNLGNYALFLENQRKDDARAEEYYLKAIAADPNHANTLGNYAIFLKNQRKDDARAEEYYLRAIAADPNHANNLGSYALFLQNQRKDDARAEEYYLRAIAADPNHANNLGSYALFLKNQRKDDARAEEYYLKAIAADPKDADYLGSYALFLQNQRKDDARAEEYYLKAIAADPNHANNLGNYVQFLIGCGRFENALPFAERAWAQLTERNDMGVVEVAFSRWLLARANGNDGRAALGRLKSLLQAGYTRLPWNFDHMLEACMPKLNKNESALARKLAAAILDETKLAELDSEPTWNLIQPTPLSNPWPETVRSGEMSRAEDVIS